LLIGRLMGLEEGVERGRIDSVELIYDC
jgi:hypothetical protein